MRTLTTTLIAVSLETIRLAELQVRFCQACDRTSDVSFACVLDQVTSRDGAATVYVMSDPAQCPNCRAPIFENTLVEWNTS